MLGRFWKWLSNLGVTQDLPSQSAKRVKLFNQIAFTLAFASAPYGLIFAWVGMNFLALIIPLIAAGYLVAIFINAQRHYNFAKFLFLGLLNIAIFFYASSFGKETGIHLMFYAVFCIPMILFELHQRSQLIVATLGSGLLIASFEVYVLYYPAPWFPLGETAETIMYFSIVPTTLALLFVMVFYFYQSNTRAEAALEEANEEMRLDLMQGGHVQQGLIEAVDSKDFRLEVYNKPYKGWVGGDGYTFLKAPNGNYWLRVSDGTGHGSSGGEAEIVDHLLFTMVISQAKNSVDALKMITETLAKRFPKAQLTYAYFIAQISPQGLVDYVNARQLAFHLNGKAEPLVNCPVIVGSLEDLDYIRPSTLTLQPSESLFVATDGIFEAKYWNEKRRKASLVGKRSVENLVHLPPQEIAETIYEKPKFTQDDDILMVKLTKN